MAENRSPLYRAMRGGKRDSVLARMNPDLRAWLISLAVIFGPALALGVVLWISNYLAESAQP